MTFAQFQTNYRRVQGEQKRRMRSLRQAYNEAEELGMTGNQYDDPNYFDNVANQHAFANTARNLVLDHAARRAHVHGTAEVTPGDPAFDGEAANILTRGFVGLGVGTIESYIADAGKDASFEGFMRTALPRFQQFILPDFNAELQTYLVHPGDLVDVRNSCGINATTTNDPARWNLDAMVQVAMEYIDSNSVSNDTINKLRIQP